MLCACQPSTAPSIETLSVSELESELSSGVTGQRAQDIRLRLASIYGKHGAQSQLTRGLRFTLDMAGRGNTDAAEILCMPKYLEAGGGAALKACAIAADAKRPLAVTTMCRHHYDAKAFGLAMAVCADGASMGLAQTYLPLGLLSARMSGDEDVDVSAVKWLILAAQDGPWPDRDPAVRALRGLDSAPDYAINPKVEDLRIGNETPASPITEVQPIRPVRFTDRGQCYLQFGITPTGLIWDTKIECSHQQLVDPVMEAAHQWRFTPRKIAGVPVYSKNQSTTMTFSAQ